MLKLRFSKPAIKTYMDGRVTICKYICTLIEGETKEVIDEYFVTGISKCSPTDKLDADYGRKLADSRAKLSAYRIASNIVDPTCIECMIEEVNHNIELIKFVDTMNFLKRKEIDHIEFLKDELSE